MLRAHSGSIRRPSWGPLQTSSPSLNPVCQVPGTSVVTKKRDNCLPPEVEQRRPVLTGSSVFPSPVQSPIPNQRVTKAFKLHTHHLRVRSAKIRSSKPRALRF